ncbi:MAG: FkbM family methyltransferase [Betaproteobacteria bacterium]|nr:FkbM family methyltransferase [Betaproteobacteria bacterium]
MDGLIKARKWPDLIYDVGLHKGEDSEFYLRKGFRVVAFEANPELALASRNRLKAFVDNGQFTIVEGAIIPPDTLKPGQSKIRFYRNEKSSEWGTVNANWAERNVHLGTSSYEIEVDAVDFTRMLQEHGIPHFMKIDIEGCDMICIEALKQFAERPDYVSVESDKTSFAKIQYETDVLTDLGYDRFQAIEQSGIAASQSPPNPPREGKYVAHRFEPGSSGLFGAELADEWKSRGQLLRQYRAIRLGYYLLGDYGIINEWKFRGAWKLNRLTSWFLRRLTKAEVPGWYDTHARHSSASRGASWQ